MIPAIPYYHLSPAISKFPGEDKYPFDNMIDTNTFSWQETCCRACGHEFVYQAVVGRWSGILQGAEISSFCQFPKQPADVVVRFAGSHLKHAFIPQVLYQQGLGPPLGCFFLCQNWPVILKVSFSLLWYFSLVTLSAIDMKIFAVDSQTFKRSLIYVRIWACLRTSPQGLVTVPSQPLSFFFFYKVFINKVKR